MTKYKGQILSTRLMKDVGPNPGSKILVKKLEIRLDFMTWRKKERWHQPRTQKGKTCTSTDKPKVKTRLGSLSPRPWGAEEHRSSLGLRGGGPISRDVHGTAVGSLSGEVGRGFEKALALDADHQGEGISGTLHIPHCRVRPGWSEWETQNSQEEIHFTSWSCACICTYR